MNLMRKTWKNGLGAALAGVFFLAGFFKGESQTTDMTVSAIFHDPAYTVRTPAGLQYRLQGDSYDVWEEVGLVRVRQDGNKQEVGRDTLVRWADVAAALSLPAGNPVFDFIWNPQRDAVLLLADREAIYRWSYRCSAYLLTWATADDAATGQGMRVLPLKGAVQEPAFSPNGQRLSYIRDNNLYVFDFKEKPVEWALTEDGAFNRILNGHTDWVYEEEFGFTKAYAWSPDSRYIAYLRSDESRVPEFGFTQWGALYPRPYVYKYPKAGEDNSTVQLIVYDLLLNRTQPLCRTEAHSTGGASDAVAYIPRLCWTPKSNTLLFYTLNRHQNHLRIWRWQAGSDGAQAAFIKTSVAKKVTAEPVATAWVSPLAKPIYEERNDCYIEITDDIYCFSDESRWLIASERDGYRHLYLYDFDGNLLRQLTQGDYEVNRLYGVDERHGRVYFSANYSAPYNIEVMSAVLDGRGLRRLAYELQAKGGVCRALFSDDYRRVILIHSAAGTAPRYCEYALDGESEQLLSVIEGNEDMQTRLQADFQPQRRFGKMAVGRYRTPFPDTIQPAGDGTVGTQALLSRLSERAAGFDTLYYWVMQPAKMEVGRRYPVLMFLYGGPGSQQVLNQYGGMDYWWYSYLVSQGYIVLCVDNRGTGGRGEAFKKCTYLQLGRYETQDQMAVVRHIAAEWDFVDPARVAIWGWSYGGFMSSSCLFRGNGLWKAAMAVAPVTSWRYYDNVYTERFMRTPAENPGGYDANSPIYWVDKQQGAYLLAHGTGDDNVHFQNSMMLVDALQAHLKPFSFQAYPNRNHSLTGGSAREHLYETMTRFLKENL